MSDSSSITANAEVVVSHFGIVRNGAGSAIQLEVESQALAVQARTPEQFQRYAIVQTAVEALLEVRARELGAEVRRGQELIGLSHDARGVTIAVQDNSAEQELVVSYLVGGDGDAVPRAMVYQRVR